MNTKPTYDELLKENEQLRKDLQNFKSDIFRLEALLFNTQLGVLVDNTERIITNVNQKFCDLFGIDSPKILIGQNCDDAAKIASNLFEDSENFLSNINKILNENKIVLNEKIKLKDGRIFERDYVPVKQDNIFYGNMWIYKNITEKEEYENKLLQYKNVVSSTKDLVSLIDKNYKFILVNEAYSIMHKLKEEDILGHSISEVVGENNFKKVKEKIDKCFTGEIVSFQDYFEAETFGHVYVDVIYTPYKVDNEILGVLINVRDITNQKNIELALKESEQNYKNFVQHSPDIIYKISNKRGPLFCSEKIKDILGYTSADFLNNPILLYNSIHHEDIELAANVLENYNSIVNYSVKYRVRAKNGEYVWLRDNFMHKTVNGNEIIIERHATDITDKMLVEQALLESENQLKTILNSFPNLVYIINKDSEIEFLNEATKIKIGRDKIGEKCYKALFGLDSQCSWCVFDKLNIELPVITFDQYVEKWDEHICFTNILFEDDKKLTIHFDITEREKSKLDLIASEKQKDRILSSAQNGIYIYDVVKGENIYINKAYTNITGWNNEELNEFKDDFMDLYHPDDRERMQKYMFEVKNINKNCNNKLEYRFKSKSGNWLYLETLEVAYETDKKGNITKLLGSFIDVTERKKAEKCLLESEEKYRLLADNASDIIWIIDAESLKFKYISPVVERIYGYKPDEVYDLQMDKIFDDKSYKILIKGLKIRFRKIYNGDEKYRIRTDELVSFHKNGEIIFVELVSKIVQNGQKFELYGISRDITERKKAEFNLKESEEKFRTFVNNSVDGICIINENHKLSFVNKAFENLTGYSRKELLGLTFIDFEGKISPNNRIDNNVHDAIFEQLQKNTPLNKMREQIITKKDGSSAVLQISIFKIKAQNSNYRLGAIVRDVTEKRKQDNELKELIATKDRFFNIIAHDLRSPFNALLGFSEILFQNHKSFDEQKMNHVTELLYESSKTAYKLVENLLAWSRTQNKKFKIFQSNFSLQHAVKKAIQEAEISAKQKNIKILNAVNIDVEVFVDLNLFDAILRNLLTNAVKFTNRFGQVVIDAEIIDSEFVQISISDNGVGIEPERLENIFKLDKETSTKGTEKETGTGLGLLLCKEFIEKQGGKIWIESEINKGSNFIFTIPLAK
ncbi:MAG: PAS domain S-box protein [Bacteroidales bacterium]|nr:PAS domain S-box protein [Bacteroidales bacterium]